MKYADVVGAAIVNDAGEILCALRSQAMSLAGHWEFPGGKIEPGETPEQSLVREIREELGCLVAVGACIAEHVHDYPNVRVRLRTYYARLTEGSPLAREHERLEWLPPSRLRELRWAPADLPTVEKLVARG